MAATKGRRVAMWTAVLAILVLVATGIALKDRIREYLLIRRLEAEDAEKRRESVRQLIALRDPIVVSLLLSRLEGKGTEFPLDHSDIPPGSRLKGSWPAPGPGGISRRIVVRAEALALAYIGSPAWPSLCQALGNPHSEVRLDVILAMVQISGCEPWTEVRDVAFGDENYTVRSVAADLLRNREAADANATR